MTQDQQHAASDAHLDALTQAVSDVQDVVDKLGLWAQGKDYYTDKTGYDEPALKYATIADVKKATKYFHPRLKAASILLTEHLTAIAHTCKGRGDPVAIVDHVGSSYGRGPKHPTVIVTHSADYDSLLKGTRLHLEATFDFAAHLERQQEWSERTFGPGARAAGVIDHIRKELREIEADPGDLREWVDVIILALDGAWRSGAAPDQIIDAIVVKQTKNEGRTWPDWRTADPNKAIEHDRNKDAVIDRARRHIAGES